MMAKSPSGKDPTSFLSKQQRKTHAFFSKSADSIPPSSTRRHSSPFPMSAREVSGKPSLMTSPSMVNLLASRLGLPSSIQVGYYFPLGVQPIFSHLVSHNA